MTDQMIKLSNFIDDLLEHRLEDLEFDIYTDKKKKLNYFALEIDTKKVCKSNNNFQFNFITQKVRLCVCPETGYIILTRDDYRTVETTDLEFTKKYSTIIKDANEKRLIESLDKIIDDTYIDLKLQRESNIRKLIG